MMFHQKVSTVSRLSKDNEDGYSPITLEQAYKIMSNTEREVFFYDPDNELSSLTFDTNMITVAAWINPDTLTGW